MKNFYKKIACFSIATIYSILYVICDNNYAFTQASVFDDGDNISGVSSSEIEITEDIMVIPLGTAFGIKLYTDGVIVSALQDIITEAGSFCPASDAGIKVGDYILSINGIEVESNTHFSSLIYSNLGTTMQFLVERDGETFTTELTPVYDGESYKVGLWIKDSAAGIGTLTFAYADSGIFGGLGHGICDSDTGELLNLKGGEASSVTINSVIKAEGSETGTLCGFFSGSGSLGLLYDNNATGIFGVLEDIPDTEAIYIMDKQDVHTGAVTIMTSIDNSGAKSFEAEIISIAFDRTSLTKNFVIQITDDELLEMTGGIVQGMSGSPIIQDGKLVGAITHVFVNDSTKGYGIFIENMLESTQVISLIS